MAEVNLFLNYKLCKAIKNNLKVHCDYLIKCIWPNQSMELTINIFLVDKRTRKNMYI